MSFIQRKHCKIFYIILFFFFLNNCQLQDPKKTHGINFLENREKVLIIGKTNKNDVIKLIGNPHSTSITGKDGWIFLERTKTKGKLIKLGQNVLETNNVLELEFDKYGILINKKIYTKNNMKKVNFTSKETKNNINQQSFVGKFLSSVKQKMYRKKN